MSYVKALVITRSYKYNVSAICKCQFVNVDDLVKLQTRHRIVQSGYDNHHYIHYNKEFFQNGGFNTRCCRSSLRNYIKNNRTTWQCLVAYDDKFITPRNMTAEEIAYYSI